MNFIVYLLTRVKENLILILGFLGFYIIFFVVSHIYNPETGFLAAVMFIILSAGCFFLWLDYQDWEKEHHKTERNELKNLVEYLEARG